MIPGIFDELWTRGIDVAILRVEQDAIRNLDRVCRCHLRATSLSLLTNRDTMLRARGRWCKLAATTSERIYSAREPSDGLSIAVTRFQDR